MSVGCLFTDRFSPEAWRSPSPRQVSWLAGRCVTGNLPIPQWNSGSLCRPLAAHSGGTARASHPLPFSLVFDDEHLKAFSGVAQCGGRRQENQSRRGDRGGKTSPCRAAIPHNKKIVALLCYLDAFSGISGDMLVGALADAGADQAAIVGAIEALETGATLSFERVKRGGISATKFHVGTQETQSHRHLSHILKIIEKAALPDPVKENASSIFRRLGEVEAAVHQMPVERVHFHEVGAVDSIADIVGACMGFHLLGVEAIVCSPINVGSGTVNTAHGLLPVPAPATAALLVGKPVYSKGPAFELATPTGAAVAVTLARNFGVLPPIKICRTGYGAGGREFAEQANVLRVIVGEETGATEATTVSVIEANIDDLSPQILAFAMERLLAASALDVTLQPIEMKKGRPGTLLRVIAKPEDREALSQIIFSETSTLGLRIYTAERRVQARTWVEVETPHGKVRMKVSGEGAYAPEYEDCRRLALEAAVPLKQIVAEANYAYLKNSR